MPSSAVPAFSALSLHDALPISRSSSVIVACAVGAVVLGWSGFFVSSHATAATISDAVRASRTIRFIWHLPFPPSGRSSPSTCRGDRKSTRLNSSHLGISYAVFCRPRVLRSFPTRRSSDLEVLVGDRRLCRRRRGAGLVGLLRVLTRDGRDHQRCGESEQDDPFHLAPTFSAFGSKFAIHLSWRSEEHTSELQSLRHLVCRLLPSPRSPLFPYTTLFRSRGPRR